MPHPMGGKQRDVYVYQRDFRKVDGVMIPFLVETQTSLEVGRTIYLQGVLRSGE